MVKLSHPYMNTGKTIAFARCTLVGKVMSLLFNMSRLVIYFLPRSKTLLISWLQSPSAVILEPKEIKYIPASTFSHLFAMECLDQMPSFLLFEHWVLSQLFHSPLSPSSRGRLVPLHFLPLECITCISEVVDISSSNFDSSCESSTQHLVWCSLHKS